MRKKMKLNWKSVSEFAGNWIYQEINDGTAIVTKIFVADGPICECGKPMQLKKVVFREKGTKEESESDIDSICDECDIHDSNFFGENENHEIEWDEE